MPSLSDIRKLIYDKRHDRPWQGCNIVVTTYPVRPESFEESSVADTIVSQIVGLKFNEIPKADLTGALFEEAILQWLGGALDILVIVADRIVWSGALATILREKFSDRNKRVLEAFMEATTRVRSPVIPPALIILVDPFTDKHAHLIDITPGEITTWSPPRVATVRLKNIGAEISERYADRFGDLFHLRYLAAAVSGREWATSAIRLNEVQLPDFPRPINLRIDAPLGIGQPQWQSITRFGPTGITIIFSLPLLGGGLDTSAHAIVEYAREHLANCDANQFIVPGEYFWQIDIGRMKECISDLLLDSYSKQVPWMTGKMYVVPDVVVNSCPNAESDEDCKKYLLLVITKESRTMKSHAAIPAAISVSLRQFQENHPDPMRVAFIMMKFGGTPAHTVIVDNIRSVLREYGIEAVRADDAEYTEDLFSNIQTYMYGCGFGIAVFERLDSDEFNPNVALEVGYMMALGKSVCVLKDKTIKHLHTDMIGRLYKSFDPQQIEATIREPLVKWLRERRILP